MLVCLCKLQRVHGSQDRAQNIRRLYVDPYSFTCVRQCPPTCSSSLYTAEWSVIARMHHTATPLVRRSGGHRQPLLCIVSRTGVCLASKEPASSRITAFHRASFGRNSYGGLSLSFVWFFRRLPPSLGR